MMLRKSSLYAIVCAAAAGLTMFIGVQPAAAASKVNDVDETITITASGHTYGTVHAGQFYTLHGGGYIELLSPWTGSLQTKVIDTSADGVGTWVRLYGTVAGGLGTHYGPRLYTTTRNVWEIYTDTIYVDNPGTNYLFTNACLSYGYHWIPSGSSTRTYVQTGSKCWAFY